MTEPIRSMIRVGYLIGRLCLAWVTCAGLFTKVVMAQETQLNGIGVEIAARSGLLTAPSDVMVSKSAAEPLLNVTQAGLLTNWHIGPVETTASLSLASASAFGARGTLPIGLLHISVRHGAFTLMLGLEQSVGVAANLRARASHDTSSRDTIPTNGGDSSSSGIPSIFLTGTQLGLASSLAATSAALVRTADAVGGIGWDHGRTRLALVAGLQTADMTASGAWISATADVSVTDGTAMTLSLRQESRNAAVQTPTFSLGLRMVHWPIMFTHGTKPVTAPDSRQHGASAALLVRVDVTDSVVSVHVLLPGAHHVVFAGDLTDWQPVGMTDERGGWWGISLPRTDRVSRLHLRSDESDWMPVPGLPTTLDEYGGMVSLLVVSPRVPLPPRSVAPAVTAAR